MRQTLEGDLAVSSSRAAGSLADMPLFSCLVGLLPSSLLLPNVDITKAKWDFSTTTTRSPCISILFGHLQKGCGAHLSMSVALCMLVFLEA
jgi:hypothetical protein